MGSFTSHTRKDRRVLADLLGIKGVDWDPDEHTLAELGEHIIHDTKIFPEATNRTVTLNSHANANTWSAWAEIADDLGTTFSSRITDNFAHITTISIESTSAAGQRWMLEVSYGAAHKVTARYRFISGSVGLLPAIQQMRIRTEHIPAGETVYYRLMCDLGGQNCTVHIRYYLH